jgi:DNA ligase-1
MLAAATDGTNLSYPLLASPKLDGIRALVIDGVVVSRSLKPIPMSTCSASLDTPCTTGLMVSSVGDMTAPDVFNKTTSGVMSREGSPDVTYYIFDDFTDSELPFRERLISAIERITQTKGKFHQYFAPVGHVIIDNHEELDQSENNALRMGFEGLMTRDPEGQYKHGRSTLKQGWLLKLKRFEDSEAEIIGYQQLMHNTNEAKKNELGYQERSSKKAGKEGKPMIGAIKVRDLKTGVEFDIGTGFDRKQRRKLWRGREFLNGKIVKYKYQPTGMKDKPRFPVFLGFRDTRDMS